jgi:hypothetical protein
MTKPGSQPEQPPGDDSSPSQAKTAGKGTDGVTPDDASPPQAPDEGGSEA